MQNPRLADGMADASRGLRHVFLRDLLLDANVGVHAHEHRGQQKVRINVDLSVQDDGATDPDRAIGPDQLSRVVDYERVARTVRAIVAEGHTKLVETLAERICAACLTDERVWRVRVRVEKLEIMKDAASVGVEVERQRG
jgi:7,8-dihydroneopterin aldolase/epimerase/oxygenase